MGKVIEVDFTRGEVLHGVEEFDGEVMQLLEEYHEAKRLGGVDLPLVEEGFAELYRAVFG